jgi:hypothetical protein
MKFCRDCKWFENCNDELSPSLKAAYAKCNSPLNTQTDLVLGTPYQFSPYCQTLRSFDNYCGRDGNWFARKEAQP